MIVGSVYLGKKARDAYRRKQAEKAAQRLTAPFDIVDPSDEIQPKVPPSSPTASNVSTTPLSAVPSESLSKFGSRSSTSDLSHSTSNRSQPKSAEEQEYNHYVQRHSGAEDPPSYDIVMSDPPRPVPQSQVQPASRPQSEASSTSRPQSQYTSHSSTISPSSALTSSTFSDRFHRNCSTCITMMEQFQTIYPHPHNVSPVQSRSSHLSQVPEQSSSYSSPTVAEMPDPSVYQQRPVPQGTGPILEAPDTGSYQAHQAHHSSTVPEMPTEGSGPVELPAEMPAQDLSELMRADTVASKAPRQEEEEESARVSDSGIGSEANSDVLNRRGEI